MFVLPVYNALADYLYDSVDAADKYIASEVCSLFFLWLFVCFAQLWKLHPKDLE